MLSKQRVMMMSQHRIVSIMLVGLMVLGGAFVLAGAGDPDHCSMCGRDFCAVRTSQRLKREVQARGGA